MFAFISCLHVNLTTPEVYESEKVTYNNITINATSTSSNAAVNTDGWDIYRSDTVAITNSVIINDDDCVSFKPSSYLRQSQSLRYPYREYL